MSPRPPGLFSPNAWDTCYHALLFMGVPSLESHFTLTKTGFRGEKHEREKHFFENLRKSYLECQIAYYHQQTDWTRRVKLFRYKEEGGMPLKHPWIKKYMDKFILGINSIKV